MPTVNERILDAQIRHSVYIERYKSGVQKQIIGLLNDVEQDLIGQIAARLSGIVARGYDLGPEQTKRLTDLLTIIQDKRADTYAVLNQTLVNEMVDFTEYEADFQVRLSDKAGVDVALTMPSNAQLKAVVTSQPFQGRLLKEWVSGLAAADAQRIQGAVRIGIVEGETIDQIVRRVRGTKAAQYQDGILEISRRDAASVVRTAVAHVQNRARMEVYNANADIVEGVRYTATLDSRTTLICASRDGNVYKVDSAPAIPAHFNCRSVYVPYFGPAAGDRASAVGPVPAETTFEDFLRKQTAEFQDEVLGKTRADLFRSGQITDLGKFVDKSGHVYTLKELKRREKI